MTTKEALAKMLNVTNASRFLRAEPLGEGVAEDPAEQSVTGSFPSTSSVSRLRMTRPGLKTGGNLPLLHLKMSLQKTKNAV